MFHKRDVISPIVCFVLGILCILVGSGVVHAAGNPLQDHFYLGGLFDITNSQGKRAFMAGVDPTSNKATVWYDTTVVADAGIRSQVILEPTDQSPSPAWFFLTQPYAFNSHGKTGQNSTLFVMRSRGTNKRTYSMTSYGTALCELSPTQVLLARSSNWLDIVDDQGKETALQLPTTWLDPAVHGPIKKMVQLAPSVFVALTPNAIATFAVDTTHHSVTQPWILEVSQMQGLHPGVSTLEDVIARNGIISVVALTSPIGLVNSRRTVVDINWGGKNVIPAGDLESQPHSEFEIFGDDGVRSQLYVRRGDRLISYTRPNAAQPWPSMVLSPGFFSPATALRGLVNTVPQVAVSQNGFNRFAAYSSANSSAAPATASAPAPVATSAQLPNLAPAIQQAAQAAAATTPSASSGKSYAANLFDLMEKETEEKQQTTLTMADLDPIAHPEKFDTYITFVFDKYNAQRNVKKLVWDEKTTAGQFPWIIRMFPDHEIPQFLRPPYLSEKQLNKFGLKLNGTAFDAIDENKILGRDALVKAVIEGIKAVNCQAGLISGQAPQKP